jgi:hypothetical protein
MRMWLVNPRIMCRQHLLGEHVELHMLCGTLRKGISVQGYIDDGLVNLLQIHRRHRYLVREMTRRGYNHKSPLPAGIRQIVARDYYQNTGEVNVEANMQELARRCKECRALITGGSHEEENTMDDRP